MDVRGTGWVRFVGSQRGVGPDESAQVCKSQP